MNTPSALFTPRSFPHAKAEGAFIALAAGDALGWPQESAARGRNKARLQATIKFRNWERRSGGQYYSHKETVQAGEYSDDTQLTLAIARCRIHAGSGWWDHFTQNELPLWTIYERGGGGATKRAAVSWLRGVAPWEQADLSVVSRYFEAGGNGVGMRVMPHAVFYANDQDPVSLLRDVVADGTATHGHPRALIGAAVYAYAAWWLLRSQNTVSFGELVSVLIENTPTWGGLPTVLTAKRGWFEAADIAIRGYEKAWREVVEEMSELLTRVREGLSAGSLADDEEVLEALGAFSSAKGSGTIGAAAAVYLAARYAAQPSQGVVRAAFAVGADTDTIASMTGGLLGALSGSDWLPNDWFSVQDCEYMRHIANELILRKTPSERAIFPNVSAKELNTLIEALLSGACDDLDFGGVRRLRKFDFNSSHLSLRTAIVHKWHAQLSDGQTIYLTKIIRKLQEEIAPASEGDVIASTKSTAMRPEKRSEARAVGVKLSVLSLGDSTAFYEGVLGLSIVKKTTKFVSFGPLSLVDGQYAVNLSGGSVALGARDSRNRIEIQVSDLNSVHDRLLKRNVRITMSIAVMPWGERTLHCFDPDGNIVEIVERSLR